MHIIRITVDERKWAGNVVNKILSTLSMIVISRINVPIVVETTVYSRSCESWRLEKEILKVKNQNNIPFHEARKIVVDSMAATYAQADQYNKCPHHYESIIKTQIKLEWGEWEGYIKKIKSTFNIIKAPETLNTFGDLIENKEPPAQTRTPFEEADRDEKPIPSTSRSIKNQIMKSPPKN